MPVNAANVQRIIDEVMAKYLHLEGCCSTFVAAFRDLQAQRRVPGGSLDEDLAAAEHYMYARAAVCSAWVSQDQMELMVIGYETVKGILRACNLEELIRTTENPTAPASVASAAWGLVGSLHGREDHDRCNRDKNPPFFNPDAYKVKRPGS